MAYVDHLHTKLGVDNRVTRHEHADVGLEHHLVLVRDGRELPDVLAVLHRDAKDDATHSSKSLRHASIGRGRAHCAPVDRLSERVVALDQLHAVLVDAAVELATQIGQLAEAEEEVV